MDKLWCTLTDEEAREAIHLGELQKGIKSAVIGQRRPHLKIRCPKCNKRLDVIYTDCGDGGCWHGHLPKHKEK